MPFHAHLITCPPPSLRAFCVPHGFSRCISVSTTLRIVRVNLQRKSSWKRACLTLLDSIGERLVESTGAKPLPPRLLNRLDEAFREAFLALLSGTVHLGEADPLTTSGWESTANVELNIW